MREVNLEAARQDQEPLLTCERLKTNVGLAIICVLLYNNTIRVHLTGAFSTDGKSWIIDCTPDDPSSDQGWPVFIGARLSAAS